MKLLGLNSPELFIILVILLSILGPKRIEKGFLLFKKLLKFLLSKDEDQSSANSKVKSEERKVKEEIVESEVKSGEAEESEVKSGQPEESEVKEETIEPDVKSIKTKKRTVKDEIIDVEVDSGN